MKYTDDALLNKVRLLPSYKGTIPEYLLIAIRSKKDTPNIFDDKMYLYINGVFKLVTSCTTNPGVPTLMGGWKKLNKYGAAIIKEDEIYYNAYMKSDGVSVRHHNGKMLCLRLIKDLLYYRDNNNNNKSEQIGKIYKGNYNTNIHFNSYNLWTKTINTLINGWSSGCQVLNVSEDYRKLMNFIPEKTPVSYALLKEF